MRKVFGMIGATVGGYAGWALGAPASMMLAFVLSMVGTGVGMYVGYRIAMHYS